MTGMRKSVGEPTILSVSTAPSVQVIEEVAEPTSSVQILDRNVGSELTIFSGLPTLFEISIKPRIEEASGAVVISDSTQSTRLRIEFKKLLLLLRHLLRILSILPSIQLRFNHNLSSTRPIWRRKYVVQKFQHPTQWMFKRGFAQIG
ncbi:hypothetical protein Nepgr_013781 [Nepenthes gracilis]|uniref:Uncharacterized protein n=1 Tax=Nepenthes gracilis TaxID=150966 RepID=A0AAD3XPR1_NEPGR|nr:hypothetical protein Nepgr_013781 [Nepenthes gracilis]